MATKRKSRKKKRYCPGQFGPGGRRVKRGTCAKTRCRGQMAGSTKGGKPKRRKTTTCLKPKRRKAAKRPHAKHHAKRKATRRTKGVMSHGHRVYGAAAKAVKRKRARKGAPKRRRRGVYGRANMSINQAIHHHHKGEVAIVKLDTGAVIGEGYTVAEAVKHAKRKRSSRARSAAAARRAVYVKAM